MGAASTGPVVPGSIRKQAEHTSEEYLLYGLCISSCLLPWIPFTRFDDDGL